MVFLASLYACNTKQRRQRAYLKLCRAVIVGHLFLGVVYRHCCRQSQRLEKICRTNHGFYVGGRRGFDNNNSNNSAVCTSYLTASLLHSGTMFQTPAIIGSICYCTKMNSQNHWTSLQLQMKKPFHRTHPYFVTEKTKVKQLAKPLY